MKLLAFLYPTLFSLTALSTPAPPPAQAPLPGRPPLGLLPVIMPDTGSGSGPNNAGVPLADILGTLRPISSFSSFTRLHESTSRLLSDDTSHQSATAAKITVLAPLNSAIDALPHKPWEDPRDYAALGSQAYDGSGGKQRADENLRRFVEAHLVLVRTAGGSWEEGVKAKTAGGRDVWWEKKEGMDGDRVIMPDRVEVERVASQAVNGEVWILKGVLNYV